jgi:hypothetical protein
MPFLIGMILAVSVGVSATTLGLDRDRAFYPTVMAVIASYYALFAVIGGSPHALLIESLVIAIFLGAAVAGFKVSPWWLVGALAAHGIFDLVHDRLIANPGVPAWWPQFCLAYDVTASAYLAWLLSRSKRATKASTGKSR